MASAFDSSPKGDHSNSVDKQNTDSIQVVCSSQTWFIFLFLSLRLYTCKVLGLDEFVFAAPDFWNVKGSLLEFLYLTLLIEGLGQMRKYLRIS